MILYNKNGTFLGIGQDELSALGYENIEEFKSYFEDFSDLFVNTPGYISKFKNFSWIEYVLHSGAPNKNVILRHKNGTNFESKLLISELSLIQEIDGFSSLYCIELATSDSPFTSGIKSGIKLSVSKEQYMDYNLEEIENSTKSDSDIQIDPTDEETDDYITQDFNNPQIQDYKEEKTNLQLNIPEEEQIHLKIPLDEQKQEIDTFEKNNFQIRTEEETVDMPAEEISLKEKLEAKIDKKDDICIDESILSDYEDSLKTEPNTDQTDNQRTTIIEKEIPIIKDKTESKDIFENIDFTNIAEETGMDLGDIGEFIGEFIGESKNYLKELEDVEIFTKMDFIEKEAIKLKSVASNLNMKNILSTLDLILESSSEDEIIQLLEQYNKQIKDLEEQLF